MSRKDTKKLREMLCIVLAQTQMIQEELDEMDAREEAAQGEIRTHVQRLREKVAQ